MLTSIITPHANNKNKVINSKCVCKKGLNWTDDKNVVLHPCDHIVHVKCLKNLFDNTVCPICNEKIVCYFDEDELKILKNKKSRKRKDYYMKYVDLLSMKNLNEYSKKHYGGVVFNGPSLFNLILKLPFTSGFDSGHKVCTDALALANIKLNISGFDNILPQNKVIIANHVCAMDFLILFYIFKCGFLASSSVKDSYIGKMLANIVPVLFIDRGASNNTVQKIHEYVNKYGSLCLFPEGIMSHPDTLLRFRTGAFYANQPICPVVLKYNLPVTDTNINEFLLKLCSQKEIPIDVHILPVENPPFNDNRIEEIRTKMAKTGNLALSRISNRDISDKE